jgi:hypothetical protein
MKPRLALPGLTAVLACLALGCLLLLATGARADDPERPNLSGTWTLNERLSENPRDKMRGNMPQRREDGRGDVETKTEWKKDGRLVVKATTERGRKIKEIFNYAPGESRLYVTHEMRGDGRMPEIEFQRVYDLVLEEPSAD